VENVSSGGSAVGALASGGGVATVSAGGVASALEAGSGGSAVVLSGGTVSGATVDASGVLALSGGAIVAGGIVISAAGAVLAIGGTALPTAPISGLTSADTIDLTGIANASASLDTGTDLLTISAGGLTFGLQLAGDYAGETATYVFDGGSGTDISVACFAAGTLIAVPGGEVAVERLRPGDLVLTQGGAAAPVRWLGVQSLAPRALFIRVRAGALGERVPRRDLLVSPGHALLVDGLLVHAGALVNGRSITREDHPPLDGRYYHVELATHAVILAEGAPAESFLDGAEPVAFDNAATRPAPDPGATALPYPRAMARRQVPASLHQRLAARAARLAPGAWPAAPARVAVPEPAGAP
jgi:hypothetical protein